MTRTRTLPTIAAILSIAIGATACSNETPVAPGVTIVQTTPQAATASPAPTITPSPTPTPAPARSIDVFALRGLLPANEQLEAYARALQARNEAKWADAAASFAQVASTSSPLAPIARLRQAQMLVRDSRADAAIAVFDAALAAPGLPPPLAMVAHQEASDALVPLGRRQEATAHLDAVIDAKDSTRAQVAEAQWDRSQLRRAAGDAGWTSDALAVVRAAPGTREGTAALDALERTEVGVPLPVAAYARYRAREDVTATRLYTAITKAPADAAQAGNAWFFLGALAERDSDPTTAMTAYSRSVEADPSGALAADARWWLGLLLEERGRHAEAAAQFRQLADDFPNATYADAASIRAAVALAASGGGVPAAAQLRSIATGRDERLAAEASRWLQVLGFATTADPVPATYLPTSFAAIAARDAQLLKPLPATAQTEWGTAPRDAATADAWITSVFGERPAPAGLREDPDLVLGIALVAAGEETVGRSLLYGVLSRVRRQPYDLLDLMRLAEAADVPDVALEACEALFDRLTPAQRLAIPLAIERYAYPIAFPTEVRAAAAAEGVPPLLMLALVRQESAFNRFAGSSAGAMGLAQVVEPTGEHIAAALKDPWPADLFDARTSLRYGAYYLAAQLKRFDGNVLAALAAYNGGPENAEHWQDIQRIPGADGYVYAIEFSETRGYLERVIENYAAYRRLYAGAPVGAIR